jgi:prolyl-tRNA synthetase
MRQSQLFTKTRKEAPSDEVSKNAILLTRAGFIHKELAGVYSYLPLGLRVLKKIENIIREEMNAVGGQELVMTALQDKNLWEKTDRWDDEKVDNWFKTNLKTGGETGLGITHEEPLTRIMSEHISSYRDLPVLAYQFQTKFRNELRAKSGIMRGKEFVMKDLYSFAKNDEEHKELYDQIRSAYIKVCNRVGIGDMTYVTFASGGIFSEFSEEFQTVSDAGEDIIYVDEEKNIAINKEVYNDATIEKLGLNKDVLVEKKAIETGNIFTLGTRFSEPLGLKYKNESGEENLVVMGSYGLGPTRLMGTVVEVFADDKGIVWPKEISPFQVHLLSLTENAKNFANEIYEKLQSEGIEVLFDDRDLRAGEKFADADLIGISMQVIIGEKSLESKMLEVKVRKSGEVREMSIEDLIRELK